MKWFLLESSASHFPNKFSWIIWCHWLFIKRLENRLNRKALGTNIIHKISYDDFTEFIFEEIRARSPIRSQFRNEAKIEAFLDSKEEVADVFSFGQGFIFLNRSIKFFEFVSRSKDDFDFF